MDITEGNFKAMLLAQPDITMKQLAEAFGCGTTSVGRYLKRFGLRTKPWTERKHSPQTKARISRTRIERGVAKGSSNPNAGEKDRPWLEGEMHPLRRWHKENPDFGEKQKGAANPIHKVQHLYEDPTYVARITTGIRAHVDQRRGSTYEEVYGLEKAAEYKQKLRDASPARMAKFGRKETAPERIVRELLEELGVEYLQEAPLGFYTVDFLVEGSQLVIQADGDYWHAHPEKFPEPTPRQKDRRRMDASCDSFLLNRGYKVLRFWESDLHSNLEICKKQVEEALDA